MSAQDAGPVSADHRLVRRDLRRRPAQGHRLLLSAGPRMWSCLRVCAPCRHSPS